MSESAEDFIAHYGVRGMKWGVRKNLKARTGPNRIAERAAFLDRKDKPWVEKVEANPKTEKMSRIAARDSKRQLKQLNKEYKDAGYNVKKAGLQQTRYDNEVAAVLQKSLERASNKVYGRSPSGLLQVTVKRNPDGTINSQVGQHYSKATDRNFDNIRKADRKRERRSYKNNLVRDIIDVNLNPVSALHPTATWSVQRRRDIAVASKLVSLTLEQSDSASNSLIHEDHYNFEDMDGFEGTLMIDDEGFYEDVRTPFDVLKPIESLEQSDGDEFTGNFLEHYGVRGMKWGVRKKSGPRPDFMPPVTGSSSGKPKWQSAPVKKTAPAAATPSSKRGGLGKKPPKPMSDEAREFAVIRMKAKKQGLQSLSNKELEVINKRLELQSKYNKAFPKQKSLKAKAASFAVDQMLTDMGELKINSFIGPRSPDAAVAVKTAIGIARTARSLNKILS